MRARRPRVRRRVAVLVGMIGLAACRIQEVPRTGREDPADIAREEIDATREAYRQALLNGDANAVAQAFTRDGALWEPDVSDIAGSDAIEAAMRRLFDHAVITDLLLEPDPIAVAAGGIAFELGRFEQTLQLAEQPPATLRGRYVIRWVRVPDGDWRIGHMMYNRYPSDTSAASATR